MATLKSALELAIGAFSVTSALYSDNMSLAAYSKAKTDNEANAFFFMARVMDALIKLFVMAGGDVTILSVVETHRQWIDERKSYEEQMHIYTTNTAELCPIRDDLMALVYSSDSLAMLAFVAHEVMGAELMTLPDCPSVRMVVEVMERDEIMGDIVKRTMARAKFGSVVTDYHSKLPRYEPRVMGIIVKDVEKKALAVQKKLAEEAAQLPDVATTAATVTTAATAVM